MLSALLLLTCVGVSMVGKGRRGKPRNKMLPNTESSMNNKSIEIQMKELQNQDIAASATRGNQVPSGHIGTSKSAQ